MRVKGEYGVNKLPGRPAALRVKAYYKKSFLFNTKTEVFRCRVWINTIIVLILSGIQISQ